MLKAASDLVRTSKVRHRCKPGHSYDGVDQSSDVELRSAGKLVEKVNNPIAGIYLRLTEPAKLRKAKRQQPHATFCLFLAHTTIYAIYNFNKKESKSVEDINALCFDRIESHLQCWAAKPVLSC
jgi:hypothetical protein